jgi:hypothetical protein
MPGYGSCPANQNEAEKVLIGDALRNAAMRFGVALTLWAKGDRADPTAENAIASSGQSARHSRPESPGAAFGDAAPAQRGRVSRPAQEEKPKGAEPDADAQKFADEARQVRTLAELEEIHKRAREAGKVTAFIKNPSSDGTGKLAVFIDWRRRQLTETDKALTELTEAANAAGIGADVVEEHVIAATGKTMDDATPAELRKAAAVIQGQKAA